MVGSLVGQYRIVEQVGRGSAGTVYKAIDESLNRAVAIKILNPDLAGTESIRRFRTEATALARLNHPAVTAIYELFRSNAELFMVMEFVRGETLEQLSERLGPLPVDRAASVIDQVLGAVGHAHGAGIVHRDIKPANVMLTVAGAVKIMDFGVARVRGAEQAAAEDCMVGTPAYMAPEQVLGGAVDGRADLYSIGIIFYRLLTGALPFTGKTPIEVLQKQMTEAPGPLGQRRHDLPEWCDTILQRALAKSPDHRFQTAEEFRAVLADTAGLAPRSELARDLIRSEEDTPETLASVALQRAETWVRAFGTVLPSLDEGSASAQAAAPAQVSVQSAGETLVLKRRPRRASGPILATATIVVMLAYIALGRAVPATPPQHGDPAPSRAADAVAPRTAQPAPQPPPQRPSSPGPEQGVSQSSARTSERPDTGHRATEPSTQILSTPSVPEPPAARPSLPEPPAARPSVVKPSATERSSTRPVAPVARSQGSRQLPVAPSASEPPAQRSGQASVPPPTQTAVAASEKRSLPPSTESGNRTRETATPVTFEAKALVASGGGHKEHDVRLVLTDRDIQLVTPDKDRTTRVLQAIPYRAVVSITYSRGHDPQWLSQDGPEIVARAGGRALGLFRRERHWLTLQTSTTPRFVVVRVSESTARKVLAALESRTGRRAEHLSARSDEKGQ
jgi:serine/threonine protein kinase